MSDVAGVQNGLSGTGLRVISKRAALLMVGTELAFLTYEEPV